jgi:hypothetical protein
VQRGNPAHPDFISVAGLGKKSGSRSGMNNNPDHISESLENHFFELKYLNSLMRIRDRKIRIRDPRWKKFGSGINIPDPQSFSKTTSVVDPE